LRAHPDHFRPTESSAAIAEEETFMRTCFAIITLLVTLSVAAQSADMKPFDLNMDRVKVSRFGGSLASSNTILVPTVKLLVTSHGSVWSKKGSASAHGKFYVEGLSKELLQELSGKIQSDLVARLRAAGKTVLTYDDVKDDPVFVKQARLAPDAKWSLPIKGGWGQPLTYLIAAPTDAQAFDDPIQGPGWWMRGVIKDKALIALVPEITFSVPQMFGEGETGYARDSAGIATDPAMVFEGAMIYGSDAKGSANLVVQRHGKRLAAEVTGTIRKINEDKMGVSGLWQQTSGDFIMTLDRTAFVDGILRVGYALNAMTVNESAKAKK
jgi:hypothetical protein